MGIGNILNRHSNLMRVLGTEEISVCYLSVSQTNVFCLLLQNVFLLVPIQELKKTNFEEDFYSLNNVLKTY